MGDCATAAKTSVWWDIDKCAVPRGRCDPHRIAHNVIAALAAAGYAGPVSIAAYGDAARVPPPVLAALSATGICLNHVPAGSKDTSEKRMLVDMLFWAFDNPPPGNYLLISGDQDLSDLLHRLRMKRYDILLVRPPNASSQALAAAAKKVWLWESLSAGEVLLPESPRASNVLGCKLNVNSSNTLKCSQSKVCFEYGRGDGNGKAGNQNRGKPLQKYVKKTSSSSTLAINQDRVAPARVVSESSAVSTSSELNHSSVSSLFSSSSDSLEGAKVDTSVLLETPTLSKSSSWKPVLSTHSRQAEATHKLVLGEKPSTLTECVPRNATLDFGATNGHYNQMSQHLRYSEVQDKLHPEFTTGGNKGKAVNRHRVKPLQKYVKKTNITFSSGSNQVDSIGVPDRPIGSSTVELDRAAVSSSSSTSKSLEVAKGDNLGQLILSHSSAQKPVASAHLHQVRAPHETILGKKPSTSVERASRNGTHDFDVSTIHYHPAYQQSQSSEAQDKLQSYSNMDDNSGKLGTEHKLSQHQAYKKGINASSASASNEIDPANGSTLSHPTQSVSALSSSESLESSKVNQSSMLLSGQKPVMTDHLHKDGAAFVFGNKTSTSFQCATKTETFVFDVNSGHCHPTYQQSQSSLLPEQYNSGTHPHIACGHSYSTNSNRCCSASPSARHNVVCSAQLQRWTSGSIFQGLDDICDGISRLNISERPWGTRKARSPYQGTPANDPSIGMPDISGHPTSLHETRSSFHHGSNTNCYLNHSSDPQSGHPPSSDTCRSSRIAHPPNLSSDMQNPGHSGEKPGYLQNSSEPEESNIADCIRYGEMNLTRFDVKKALELAIRQEAVIMKKLLNDMPLFVAKDESLWKCVNVTNSKAKNPKEELDTVHKYISSTDGHSAIKNSQSRYQAATILKKWCLQHCALGDILQVLHIVIVRMKWLVPHSSGWQPLSLNTTVVIATTDATGKAKSYSSPTLMSDEYFDAPVSGGQNMSSRSTFI